MRFPLNEMTVCIQSCINNSLEQAELHDIVSSLVYDTFTDSYLFFEVVGVLSLHDSVAACHLFSDLLFFI